MDHDSTQGEPNCYFRDRQSQMFLISYVLSKSALCGVSPVCAAFQGVLVAVGQKPCVHLSSIDGVILSHMRWSVFDHFLHKRWQYCNVLTNIIVGGRLKSWSQFLMPRDNTILHTVVLYLL